MVKLQIVLIAFDAVRTVAHGDQTIGQAFGESRQRQEHVTRSPVDIDLRIGGAEGEVRVPIGARRELLPTLTRFSSSRVFSGPFVGL